jgi:hypothetical protein
MLDNVLSLAEKQCWDHLRGLRRPYVEHRETKTVVVAEVKYVGKNISNRNIETSNGYIAGGTWVLHVNEQCVLLKKYEMGVHSASESEFE